MIMLNIYKCPTMDYLEMIDGEGGKEERRKEDVERWCVGNKYLFSFPDVCESRMGQKEVK